jgi:uncharacterized protein (TIGR00730 family)
VSKPSERPRPGYRTGDPRLDRDIERLVADAAVGPDADLLFEMVVSALRLGRESADRGDLKLVNAALKELRYSFEVFAPYAGVRKVSMFGSARITPGTPEYETARAVGRLLAESGWMVITGGGPGIMAAGVEGAGLDRSFGVGIRLPFEEVPSFAVDDPKWVNFRYFFTRKLTFIKQSHGFVLLPGGYGTLDEAFEVLCLQQTGRAALAPIVLLDPPGSTYWETWLHFVEHELTGRGLVSPHDLELVRIARAPEEVCDELLGFYRIYHSSRYVGRRLVLRLTQPIDDALLSRLNNEFADILTNGSIESIGPTQSEIDDDDFVDLPRIAMRFDRRNFSRLRVLIDVLNGRR